MSLHNRRSMRLKGFDYSAGVFFVTLVTANRECVFGDVRNDEMQLNTLGLIVQEEWRRSAEIRPEIHLDAFVVMPNHLHAIVGLATQRDAVGAHGRAPLPANMGATMFRPARSLGSLVAGFKSAATHRVNTLRRTPNQPLWQRNYYDHVIRNDAELDRIRAYIIENPRRWADDTENPNR
jgi:REP element-mobilizing transposase RayT